MKKSNLIIAILFIAILAIAVVDYVFQGNGSMNFPEKISSVKEKIEDINPLSGKRGDSQMYEVNVETVMKSFLEDFINSTPPETGQEGWGLTGMVGVEDIPDSGYEIGEISYQDNVEDNIKDGYAEVKVTLKYSDGDIVKTFYLSKTDDFWYVDSVSN